MTTLLVFGSREPNIDYMDRRAAYVVVVNAGGKVGMVKGREKYFLPGGGSLSGETAKETIIREVDEELARGVRLNRKLGDALQYFYSVTDNCHYKMRATFYAGEFTGALRDGAGEHEVYWLSPTEAGQSCFHACHAWAVRQA